MQMRVENRVAARLRVGGLALALAAGLMGLTPIAAHAEEGASVPAPAVEDAAADAAAETGVAPLAAVVAADRVIGGTLHFAEGTTLAQRETVAVGATRVSDDPEADGLSVDPANISYDPVSGNFELVNLEPGEYQLGVRMAAPGGWWFAPGSSPESAWDGAGGTFTGRPIDVSEADQTEVELYFDPGLGGVGISLLGVIGWGESAEQVVVTNTANDETAFITAGSGFAGPDGPVTIYSRAFVSGTEVTLHIVVDGVAVYYDGTPTGTLDVAQAAIITIPLWEGIRLETLDLRPYRAGVAPNADELEDERRGTVVVPAEGVAGSAARVFVGAYFTGATVWGWMYSDPTRLGTAVVDAEGYATFTLPQDVTGDHRIAIAEYNGSLIGWGEIAISAANTDSGEIVIDGESGTAASTGGTGTAQLAATGGAVSPLAVAGLAALLLLAGATAVVVRARARQQRTDA